MEPQINQPDRHLRESDQVLYSKEADSQDVIVTPDTEYPSVLVRTIVISSLMLAVFLVMFIHPTLDELILTRWPDCS
jgi:hypothetical protein